MQFPPQYVSSGAVPAGGRGCYFGCRTRENQVAWGLGGFLVVLGLTLLAVGGAQVRDCTAEFQQCEMANWGAAAGAGSLDTLDFGGSTDPCVNDVLSKCRMDKG